MANASLRSTRLSRTLARTVVVALVVAVCAVTAAAAPEAARHKKKATHSRRRARVTRPWRDPRVSAIRQVPTAMIWARDRPDGRDSVHVDTEGMVTGVYDHTVLRFTLAAPGRGAFRHFLETSGEVAESAVEAPRVRLVVHGTGTGGQLGAARRAVTNWLVSTAAGAVPDPVQGAFNPLMFAWIHGGGGNASGPCDTVLITYAGEVTISHCPPGGGAAVSWLSPIDLATVYDWADSLRTFTSVRGEGELDSSRETYTTLTLRGFGSHTPSDSLKNALHSWAHLLATRARGSR